MIELIGSYIVDNRKPLPSTGTLDGSEICSFSGGGNS